MMNQQISNERFLHEAAVAETFLKALSEDSFTELFNIFTPRLVSFFRARGCELAVAEDLAQEVMLIVHCKAAQIRDRTLFRAWLFKIARNAFCRHYGKQTRQVETVDLADLTARTRSHDTALHRAVGIPRDRGSQGHPDRDSAVEGA